MQPEVLSKNSDFFRTALQKDWLNEDYAIKLPEDEMQIVKTYVTWLYTGKITCEKLPSDFFSQLRAKERQWILTAKFYVFGEKMMDTGFQNVVIDSFAAIARECPYCSTLVQRRKLLPSFMQECQRDLQHAKCWSIYGTTMQGGE